MPATPSFLCLRDHTVERPKPGAVTFTPAIAKRDSTHFDAGFVGDIFTTGIKIQGETGAGKHDTLTFPRGSEINSPQYNHIDTNQGTLIAFIRPNWDGDDSQGHILFHDALSGISIRKLTSDYLVIYTNSMPRALVDTSGWTCGTKHLIAVRWDAVNTIDATHHACITVDNAHTFTGGMGTTAWTANAPAENIHIGSTALGSLGQPWNGLIEGLTLYRRVLYDGTYGTDADNGDELDQLYNSGDFAKPIPITGREDITFYLPTDESEGTLTSGTGEAYTFPHDQNLITGTPTAEGGGGGAAPTLTETDDPIYNQTAYQIADIDAIGDGLKTTYDCSGDPAGQNYLAPIWIKDDGTNIATLRIHDATNNADITTADTSGAGTWEHLAPNFDRPAGCNSIEITVEATDAGSGNITTLPPQLYTATGGTVAWSDVDLTATPATLANSINSGAIRIDGRDQCHQDTHLLTPRHGDLRFHAELMFPSSDPTALYRALHAVYNTPADTDDRSRTLLMPIPYIMSTHSFDGDGFQEMIGESVDTQRHSYRIRWTPHEVAFWMDHQLEKRWDGHTMTADLNPQIGWGYELKDSDLQLDGWISP